MLSFEMLFQIASLSSRGLSVAGITGNVSMDVVKKVFSGDYQLLFFTPEMLIEQQRWRLLFRKEEYATRLKAFVVDEAHTVKVVNRGCQ